MSHPRPPSPVPLAAGSRLANSRHSGVNRVNLSSPGRTAQRVNRVNLSLDRRPDARVNRVNRSPAPRARVRVNRVNLSSGEPS